MVLVRRIQKRGANIVVEAHGEVEFLPGGDVQKWLHRFSQRARNFAAKEAPSEAMSNKRPRWKHYGKPLNETMRASTTTRTVLLKNGNVMRVYSAMGSTAPYAYYVDQGTGVFNGGSPWEAKILPPWRRYSPSLYEKRWFPALYSPEVRQSAHRGAGFVQSRPVMIDGQKGQHFFDKALARTFRYMRIYGTGGVTANLSAVLATMPTGMANFAGNTPVTTAFKMSLREWREWRDDAYLHRGKLIGDSAAKARFADRRERKKAWQKEVRAYAREEKKERTRKAYKAREAERSRKNRQKAKQMKESQTRDDGFLSRAADRQRVLEKAYRVYGRENVDVDSLERRGDRWALTVRVFTKREGDGRTRPEYKVVTLKAKSK